MTQPIAMRRPGGIRFAGCLIGLMFLFVLAAVGGIGWMLYPRQAPTANPSVMISAPQTGMTTEMNKPVRVSATAEFRPGITRMELYADGALVAVQTSNSADGLKAFYFATGWTPKTAGRHVLVARAFTRESRFADSSVVYVDVIEQLPKTILIDVDRVASQSNAPRLSLNQISSGAHVPLYQVLDQNPQMASVDPNASLPAGTTIEITSSDSNPAGDSGGDQNPAPPLPSPLPGTPASPQNLVVSADCSGAQLTWTDTPDAEQYAVYRLEPESSSLDRIATLPAHTTTYRETHTGLGEYRYQVAAVRNGLEGPSSLVTTTTPGTCVPPEVAPNTTELLATYRTLQTRESFDGVYCYLSINGMPYQRIPSEESSTLRPNRDGLTYNLSAQLPNRGQILLSPQPQAQPVTLIGECWGKRGATSLLVGRISGSHPSSDWDGHEIRENAMSPNANDLRLVFRIGPDTPDGIRIALDPTLFGYVTQHPELTTAINMDDALIPAPYNVRLTRRFPFQSENESSCETGFWAIICGSGLPVVVWDWEPNLLFPASAFDGFDVMAMGADVSHGDPFGPPPGDPSNPTILHEVTLFDWYQQRHIRLDGPKWVYLYNFPRLNDTCGYANKIAVYALRRHGTRSDAGETPLWRTPPCANAAAVTLNYVGLTLRNMNFQSEGGRCHFLGFADCLGRDQARAIIQIGSYPLFRHSPGEGEDGAVTLTNQEYGLSEISLSDQCTDLSCDFSNPHYRHNNNSIVVIIRDDATPIRLTPYITDRDGMEEICHINPFAFEDPDYPLHARSVLEWQRIQQTNQTVVIRGSSPNAQCEYTIMPVGAPASP